MNYAATVRRRPPESLTALGIYRLDTGLDNANRETGGHHMAAWQVAGPFDAVSTRIKRIDFPAEEALIRI
jgi:hypothetical protein